MRLSCWIGSGGTHIGRVAATLLVSVVAAQWTDSSPFLRSRQELEGRSLQTVNNCTESCCQQYVAACPKPADGSNLFKNVPFGAQIALIIVLLLITAAFAGLTLGLVGLDKTGLEIIMDGDDPVNAARAKRIYPLRKRGNLLLCSLVLGNIATNSILSILLADKAGGLIGFLLSTFLIVIFGEIIPQAFCSRYSLAIGSASVPMVRVVMFVLLPIAYPLSWILDKALGKEIATTYSTSELMKLLQIHVSENALDPETAIAMTGALKYKNLSVKDVMTPVERIFMLSVDDRLNYETMANIFKTGFSRIPVYEVDKVCRMQLLS
jgi:metal transporter CNNM